MTINVYELVTVGSYDTKEQAMDAIRRHWTEDHGTAQLPGFVMDAPGNLGGLAHVWSLEKLAKMEDA